MIRSPLRLFAALALVALTLFVVACGGRRQRRERRRHRQDAATAPRRRARRAASSTQLGASDVDFIDPGQTYYTGGYQVIYATQTTALRCPSPTSDEAVPDLADGAAADLRRQEVGHGQAQEGRQVRPAGQPRGPGEGRQVRVRARGYQERAEPVHDATSTSSRASRRSRARCRTSPASRRRQPVPITFKLTQGPRAGAFAASLIMPITTPVPKEYAEKFDKKSPSTYNEHVVSTGPYMVENDAQGKLDRLQGRQVDPPRPQPELEQDADFRPAYLDEIDLDHATRPTPTWPAARSSRART